MYNLWGSHSGVDVYTGVVCGLLYYLEDGSKTFRRNVGIYTCIPMYCVGRVAQSV